MEQKVLCYLSRRLGGDSVAGYKAELLRPHEAGRRRLARHYGDGFGKHLLSAAGRRRTSCVGLAEAACQPASQKHRQLLFFFLENRPARILTA